MLLSTAKESKDISITSVWSSSVFHVSVTSRTSSCNKKRPKRKEARRVNEIFFSELFFYFRSLFGLTSGRGDIKKWNIIPRRELNTNNEQRIRDEQSCKFLFSLKERHTWGVLSSQSTRGWQDKQKFSSRNCNCISRLTHSSLPTLLVLHSKKRASFFNVRVCLDASSVHWSTPWFIW